jgi:hypothetical protein
VQKFLEDEKKLLSTDVLQIHTFHPPIYQFHITFTPDGIFPTTGFSIFSPTFFVFFFFQKILFTTSVNHFLSLPNHSILVAINPKPENEKI